MKKGSIALVSILVAFGMVFFWFLETKGNLVTLKEDVSMQQSQIETTLQRRSDLIPNLVATVKGYAEHEEAVFTEIAEARSKLAGSIKDGDLERMNEANSSLDFSISRLLAISENYPELKASEHFIALQDELAGTENRIYVARQHYNEKVKTYNDTIQQPITSIVAGICGYHPMPYFKADEKAQEVPTVDFN